MNFFLLPFEIFLLENILYRDNFATTETVPNLCRDIYPQPQSEVALTTDIIYTCSIASIARCEDLIFLVENEAKRNDKLFWLEQEYKNKKRTLAKETEAE